MSQKSSIQFITATTQSMATSKPTTTCSYQLSAATSIWSTLQRAKTSIDSIWINTESGRSSTWMIHYPTTHLCFMLRVSTKLTCAILCSLILSLMLWITRLWYSLIGMDHLWSICRPVRSLIFRVMRIRHIIRLSKTTKEVEIMKIMIKSCRTPI